jgi:hypothetical protein
MEEIIFLSSIATFFSVALIWCFTPRGKKWRRDNGLL